MTASNRDALPLYLLSFSIILPIGNKFLLGITRFGKNRREDRQRLETDDCWEQRESMQCSPQRISETLVIHASSAWAAAADHYNSTIEGSRSSPVLAGRISPRQGFLVPIQEQNR
jgi:hypothetical protein